MGRQGWLCESLTHDTGQEAGQTGSQRPLQSARRLSGLAEKVGSGEAEELRPNLMVHSTLLYPTPT